MNNCGKWYLEYTYLDRNVGFFKSPVEKDKKVVLNATTENNALFEAKARWEEIETDSEYKDDENALDIWSICPNPRVVLIIPIG